MADLIQTAFMEVSAEHKDYLDDIERVKDLLSPHYHELQASANRLYPEDKDGWQRHIVNGYKEILLREYDKSQPHFPLSMYGVFATEVVEQIATAYNVSSDLIVTAMLAAVSAAAGSKFKVSHKVYTNTLSMWWCLVAPSGYGKTEPLSPIIQPVEEINKRLVNQTKAAIKAWKQNGQQGDKPRKRQMMIYDTTPEARDELLADNPEGLFLYRDELAGFFNDIGRYNNSGEVENYLSIWSGKGYSVNRKTSEPLYIEHPNLTILGGLQTERLAGIFSSRGMMENGFFARWAFVCPTIFAQRTFNAVEIPQSITERWAGFIEALNDQGTQPRTFVLSDEASSLHDRFFARISDEMIDPQTNPRQKEVLAKLRIMVFRLAGIIHLLRNGQTASETIDAEAMEAAVLTIEAIKQWNYKALSIIQSGNPHAMSRGELVRAIRTQWPKMNVSMFCEAVGLSRDSFNYYFR